MLKNSATGKAKNGALSQSDLHYKEGRQSLLWEWQDSGSLIIDHLPGLVEATKGYPGGQPEVYEQLYYTEGLRGGMKLWVYRDEAHPTGELTFTVASNRSQPGR